MHFTREPIIETVIAAKDGHKLVLRSSKISGQEEFQVDAIEVVSFGQALFFRSLEKPRIFMVPVGDYEVLEAKESRIALKNVSADKVIKIAGGKEAGPKEAPKERRERNKPTPPPEPRAPIVEEELVEEDVEATSEGGDRRKRRRRRRGGRADREDAAEESQESSAEASQPSADSDLQEIQEVAQELKSRQRAEMLPPPPALISETLARYREGKAPKNPSSQGEDDVLFFAETAEESLEDQPQ